MTGLPGEVTRLLHRLEDGDRSAVEPLLPLVYEELRALASSQMRGERRDHTLQPTALVNEAWLRLNRTPRRWDNRHHFYRVASMVMRYILVDSARQRRRCKELAGLDSGEIDENLLSFEDRALDMIALDDALTRLETIAPRQTDIIELRFFCGLSVKETAELLGLSERTVNADWHLARAWLLREMDEK